MLASLDPIPPPFPPNMWGPGQTPGRGAARGMVAGVLQCCFGLERTFSLLVGRTEMRRKEQMIERLQKTDGQNLSSLPNA